MSKIKDRYIEKIEKLTVKDIEGLKQSHLDLEKKILSAPATRRIYEDTSFRIELGIQARRIREKAKLTQTELARRLHTRQEYITRLERGAQNVTIQTLTEYAAACGKHLKISFTA